MLSAMLHNFLVVIVKNNSSYILYKILLHSLDECSIENLDKERGYLHLGVFDAALWDNLSVGINFSEQIIEGVFQDLQRVFHTRGCSGDDGG